jgi:outer membrane protein OmpA-like peptidoglycan-associated protein
MSPSKPFRLLVVCGAATLAACQSNPTKPTSAAPAASPQTAQAAQPAPAAPACEKLPTMSNNQRVAAGAAIGAAAGLLVTRATGGSKGRHYATGALGGALVGALAGSAFKNEIDVEEQPDGSVRLKIPGSVMFATGQSALSAGFQSTLTSVTTTIKKYCGVTVRVVGHTDSMGVPASNQQLSERRAAAVQAHMQGQGLERARVAIEGKGEREPVASNADEAGRQQNRRVEIFVRPPAG